MFSLSSITAGFIAVMVGYTGSAAIIFQATQSLGVSPEVTSSWMWALGMGMAMTSIGLSLRYKAPIVTAWSTPGAAILVTALSGVSLDAAIGAFMFSALLMIISGVSGWFERVMHKLPVELASAMLAGVLAKFGMDVFFAMQNQMRLVLPMCLIYLLAKRVIPSYSVVLVFLLGLVLSFLFGEMDLSGVELQFTVPVFTFPSFDLSVLISVGIPLFIVTMASQNMPGVAVLRSFKYDTPISPLISWTGITTLVLAPFGCFAINLAAITAAICMSEDAHPDKNQRFQSSVAAGVIHIIAGVFAATIAALFFAFPQAFVLAIAGIALFSTIGNSLATALSKVEQREPALITFLVTLSGFTLAGIGSAFWGLIAGVVTMLILNSGRTTVS